MRYLIGWLPIALLACGGCGKTPPAIPESEIRSPSRVLAVARDLEDHRKMKQAMDAYHQVVRHFPGTPEARQAQDRITKAERDASQRVASRRK